MSRTKSKERKKVTALIKKPYLYTERATNFDGAVDVDPASAFTLDPYSVLTREDSKLKVRIPFTRYYRLKCTITPSDLNPNSFDPDPFSINKPILLCTERLKLKRDSSGVVTELQDSVYSQDGSGLIVYEPISTTGSGVLNSFIIRQNVNAAVVEGIVYLYAGDVLTFEHSLRLMKSSEIRLGYFAGGLSIFNTDNGAAPYLPRSLNYDFVGNYVSDGVYSISVNVQANNQLFYSTTPQSVFSSSASFFFEISEITDL